MTWPRLSSPTWLRPSLRRDSCGALGRLLDKADATKDIPNGTLPLPLPSGSSRVSKSSFFLIAYVNSPPEHRENISHHVEMFDNSVCSGYVWVMFRHVRVCSGMFGYVRVCSGMFGYVRGMFGVCSEMSFAPAKDSSEGLQDFYQFIYVPPFCARVGDASMTPQDVRRMAQEVSRR